MQSTRKWGVALSVAAVAAAATWAAVGVSGPAGATVAAGQVTAAGSTAPGGTWGPAQQVPGLSALAPSGWQVTGAGIAAISCPAPGGCVATGTADTRKDGTVSNAEGTVSSLGFVVSQTDGTWGNAQVVKGAFLSPVGGNTLGPVACGAPGDCSAFGAYSGAGAQSQVFVVTESAGIWKPASVIDESALGSGLSIQSSSVSCSAAGECAAVGYAVSSPATLGQAFVMDEQGGSWGPAEPVSGLDTLQPAGDAADLTSVSCAAPGDCTAAGVYYYGDEDFAPLLVTEVNHTWGGAESVPAFSALASPGGQVNGELDSISCPEATACTTVGTYNPPFDENGAGAFTVDEGDAGWGNAQKLSTPGQFEIDLRSPRVSCSSAGNCATIGLAGSQAFVATESGSGPWGAGQLIPGIPAGDDSVPTGISCAPGGNCTVAGYYDKPESAGGPLEVDQGFVATGTPGGSFGAAQPLLSPSNFAGGVGPQCPQTGYCVLSGAQPGGPAELVTEATAANVTLKASRPTLTFGAEQAETLTATVASPAGGTPTGTVTVTHGSAPACTIKLANGTGKCTLTPEKLPGGTDRLTASYSGDASYVAASSGATVKVYGARSTTRLTLSKTTITYGHENAEKLSVSVSQTGNVGPTGRVTIQAGRTTICTITLNRDNGSCTLSTKKIKPGTYRLTASFPGNGNYDRSTSPVKVLRVAR